jgi:hypothetical protein
MRAFHLLTALALGFCAVGVACLEDPVVSDTDGGDTETGDSETGDGDGDPENVVVDLFNETCGLTATWTSVTVGLEPIPIPCDMQGLEANGWMVRYVELMLGDVEFNKVISLVAGITDGAQIQGLFNLDDVTNPEALEFRAEVLVVCAEGDADCVGRFALAVAEDTPTGLFSVSEDRDLASGMQAVTIAVPLFELVTLSEPSVVLVAERTEPDGEPSPELLIVNPRLVLP